MVKDGIKGRIREKVKVNERGEVEGRREARRLRRKAIKTLRY